MGLDLFISCLLFGYCYYLCFNKIEVMSKLGYEAIKNHFEEVEPKNAPVDFDSDKAFAWSSGYNYCLLKTNAPELLEALKAISEWDKRNEAIIGTTIINRVNSAIKKASK